MVASLYVYGWLLLYIMLDYFNATVHKCLSVNGMSIYSAHLWIDIQYMWHLLLAMAVYDERKLGNV